jgi:UDP-2,4-diacetamido-2,4,6-trideoxy-beta-L-altropyranose hydrolase
MSLSCKVAIRTDASITIGAGHVMRCLTLAEELRRAGAEVCFICCEGRGDMLDIIHDHGFPSSALESKGDWHCDAEQTLSALKNQHRIDWLVVDHYHLDRRWESLLRPTTRNILVIDDLADRTHDCDALLDQNYYRNAKERYVGLVSSGCRLFLGPEYALLRNEFHETALRPRSRDGHVRRILITFGATDPTNETGKVLSALNSLGTHTLSADVVIGQANPRRTVIEQQCAAMPGIRCHVQTTRMAELMHEADLAIGASGATTWERCILGLPTLTVTTADNQVQTANDLAADGVIWLLGPAESLTVVDYENALRTALECPARLQDLSSRARNIMAPATVFSGDKRHPLADTMLKMIQNP